MNQKNAAKYFERMGGREGLAQRALEIAQEIVEAGSYKRAIAGAGQMKVIAEISQKSDHYWSQIVGRGYHKEHFYAETPKAIKPILGDDGYLCEAHWDAERAAGLLE